MSSKSWDFQQKFLFVSSGATIGAGHPTDYFSRDDMISDAPHATPHNSYGATKAACELFLTDYAWHGFVDGRGVRLPTIIVRAGAPNDTTTSCFSAIICEPLACVDVKLPIAMDVKYFIAGKRNAIKAMITVHNAKPEKIKTVLGFDHTIFLPAQALALGDLQEALMKVLSPESVSKLGRMTYKVDQFLSDVVGGFPSKINANRALDLGISNAPDAEMLVREYTSDFPSALAKGIALAAQK